MPHGIPTIDYALCMACGCCVQACPFSYLDPARRGVDSDPRIYPQLVAGHRCTGCGLCVTACPIDCVTTTLANS